MGNTTSTSVVDRSSRLKMGNDIVNGNGNDDGNDINAISPTASGEKDNDLVVHEDDGDDKNGVIEEESQVNGRKSEEETLVNNGSGDGENDQEDLYGDQNEAIPETIYSLMFVSPFWTKAYWYAIVLCAVQIVITVAAMVNIFNINSSNPAQIPPGVEPAVSIAQALVLPIIVASQPNFIEGLIRLNDRANERIEFDPLAGSFANWFLSSTAQLVVGVGLLVVAFVFTMQAESVFRVLVNIVTLVVVANISTTGFMMANKGFLGYDIWKESVNVKNHKIDRSYETKGIQQILFVLCVLAMYIAFFVVVYRQASGFYRCTSVLMQFDDTVDIQVPLMSGIYTQEDKTHVSGRFRYVDTVNGQSTFLSYCPESESWGVAPVKSGRDQCTFGILSARTTTFDASKTGDFPWRVRSQRDGTLVPMLQSIVQCVDCDESSCLPHRGKCVENRCECFNNRYGVHCEFWAPCEKLVINANNGNFPPIQSLLRQDYTLLPSEYVILKDDNETIALVNDRPVWNSQDFQFVILFNGRRWVIISPTLTESWEDEYEQQEARKHLLSTFRNKHMYDYLTQSGMQILTVSEEVELESPNDSGMPIGLHWIATRIVYQTRRPTVSLDHAVIYDPVFVCAHCDEEVNKCQNLGVCVNSTGVGLCQCRTAFDLPTHVGALCERQITCKDIQQDYGYKLPSGCIGSEYVCRDDGRCSCTADFPDVGNFCQFLPCSHKSNVERFPPNGCANPAVCSNITGDCSCDDRDRFEGKYCQSVRPNCFDDEAIGRFPPEGCSGQGECNEENGFCSCNSTFFVGRYCEIYREPCYSDAMLEIYPGIGCDRNGTCNNETGSCECPLPIYTGHYCEVANFECSDPRVLDIFPTGCNNDGRCNTTTGFCSCPEPFRGRYCQRILDSHNSTLP